MPLRVKRHSGFKKPLRHSGLLSNRRKPTSIQQMRELSKALERRIIIRVTASDPTPNRSQWLKDCCDAKELHNNDCLVREGTWAQVKSRIDPRQLKKHPSNSEQNMQLMASTSVGPDSASASSKTLDSSSHRLQQWSLRIVVFASKMATSVNISKHASIDQQRKAV
ncbi:hypothetical protein Nepgr_007788 [Nepenthes gracilis]|uniref:Uncharacterized protein n=1 Tax=Nepenthes gracilis TaxID=150966 RepID=A0AAD3S7Q4_NEPGR|nr:hypothetical protein Nepgr_007788 [Nepenthes gracilis]